MKLTAFLTSLSVTFALIAGCSHKIVKDPAAARTLMFPNGSYQHDITLLMIDGPQARKPFHFSGAVEIQPDKISLVAFSPFGTTLFRITDDRKSRPDSIRTEIYADQIKPHEQQMKQFYGTIRSMLVEPYAGEKSRTIQTPSGPATLTFEHIDTHGICDQLSVVSAHFSLRVKVVGYEI